jgi:hypothetical protein
MKREPRYGNRGDYSAEPKLATFPHADSEHLEDAPDACLRCGGPWTPCEEGYRCVTCSKRWRVADVLRANMGKPLAHTERPAAIADTRVGIRRRVG